jgi:hypothetical protein
MTTGSGPADEKSFDEFLEKSNIQVYQLTDYEFTEYETDVLVIGHDNWDKQKLDAAIQARSGGHFRVYSQEMVFASLAMGADVFDLLSTDELIEFGIGHPALEYLMDDMGFDWPTTEVVLRSNSLFVDFSDGEWPEDGVLRKMGYKTGQSGLIESVRRVILSNTLNNS